VPHLGFGVRYGSFHEVLEPFVKVAMHELDVEHVHSFDIDSLVKKCSRRLLNCEYIVHLHQYYAFP
jgi:hypothetical protein